MTDVVSIRSGSKRLSIDNESLIVFLYDESHSATLAESGADFESGYAETDSETEPALKKLAKNSVLFAYELRQDDAVELEVIVGQPLSRSELSQGLWMKPQRGHLILPTGKLRIDTGLTLPMNQSGEQPDEEPGRVMLSPGIWMCTLYRLDWDAMMQRGVVSTPEAWNGPNEVVVLTPLAQGESPKANRPLYRYQRSGESWKGAYHFEGSTFVGKVMAPDPLLGFSINVDAAALDRLGIQQGNLVRIEVESLVIDVVYAGESDVGKIRILPSVNRPSEFGVMIRLANSPDIDQRLYVERHFRKVPVSAVGKWIPARLTVLETTFPLAPS